MHDYTTTLMGMSGSSPHCIRYCKCFHFCVKYDMQVVFLIKLVYICGSLCSPDDCYSSCTCIQTVYWFIWYWYNLHLHCIGIQQLEETVTSK